VIVWVDSKLVATPFRGFDHDAQHPLIVCVERLEAGWVRKPVFSCSSNLLEQ
jgi:hypothetical protein